MVQQEKSSSALSSLQAVLVLARLMAYEQRPHEDIARVLDVAEYLPALLLEKRDTTREFRECLEGLAATYPQFSMAVERFDRKAD